MAQDKPKDSKGAFGTVAAIITGAAVGAAAVALSDKKNREILKKKAGEVQKKGSKQLESLEKKASSLAQQGKAKLVETLESAKHGLENKTGAGKEVKKPTKSKAKGE